MSRITIEQIQPGAVFRFKTALRRVTSITAPMRTGFHVNWEYADGKKRGGRLRGSQWVHYFRAAAIEQIPDPMLPSETRTLKCPSGRVVPCLAENTEITLVTRCPQKWAFVDLETGDLWGHDGLHFRRLSEGEICEVAWVVNQRGE